MRIIPATADFTARDFDALDARQRRVITSVFPGWTNWSEAGFDNILREILTNEAETIEVYEANHFREAFAVLCTRRINMIRHARAVGYRMSGPTAATATLTFTLRQTYPGDVLFPKGFVIRTPSATNPVRGQLTADMVILAGMTTGVATWEHAITHPIYYQASDAKDQEFELSQTPFLEVTTLADDAGSFAEVDNYLESTSTSGHFMVLASEAGRGMIRFGDDRNGRIPSGTVSGEYKTGGGAVTIDPGFLTVAESSVSDTLGNQVLFDVTNLAASSGGAPQETVDQARERIPAAIAAGDRTVGRTDFETRALSVDGVARALMVTSNEVASLDEAYGQLLLVGQGSKLASGLYGPTTVTAAQRDAVKALIDEQYPAPIGFRFDVLAAPMKTIDVTTRLWLTEGANPEVVDTAIRAALADYFAVLNANLTPTSTVDFGLNYKDEVGDSEPLVPWGAIFSAIRDTAGVRRVDEDALVPADPVALTATEFPELGDVSIINARTGLELV